MRHLPDSRVARVAVWLAASLAVVIVLLLIDYDGNSNPSRRAGPTIDGIPVEGNVLSTEDVRAIRDALDKEAISIEAIVHIKHTEQDNVEVYTGELRGPLDGGGKIYLFKKIDGVWTLSDDGWHRSWMS